MLRDTHVVRVAKTMYDAQNEEFMEIDENTDATHENWKSWKIMKILKYY